MKVVNFYRICIIACLAVTFGQVRTQSLSAEQILQKCIQRHDPMHKWQTFKGKFDMSIVRAGHQDRFFTIGFDKKKDAFTYAVDTDSIRYEQSVSKGKFVQSINGNADIDEKTISQYQLTPQRTQYLKEVYDYLFGVPMRLNDDISMLNDTVKSVSFNTVDCFQLTFEYLPVGENETWYFFINSTSYTLEGYQFFKDDINTDGEFILLKDYEVLYDLLIAKTKLWYWNKDGSFFRTDSIINK